MKAKLFQGLRGAGQQSGHGRKQGRGLLTPGLSGWLLPRVLTTLGSRKVEFCKITRVTPKSAPKYDQYKIQS